MLGHGVFYESAVSQVTPVLPGLLFINLWEILTEEHKCWQQSKDTSWYDILSLTIKTFICPQQAAVFGSRSLFVMTAANDRNKTTVATKTL